MTARPRGETIDVSRIISTGQDRKTGDAILRVQDQDGRTFALRLSPERFKTLAKGVLGLALARSDLDEIR